MILTILIVVVLIFVAICYMLFCGGCGRLRERDDKRVEIEQLKNVDKLKERENR